MFTFALTPRSDVRQGSQGAPTLMCNNAISRLPPKVSLLSFCHCLAAMPSGQRRKGNRTREDYMGRLSFVGMATTAVLFFGTAVQAQQQQPASPPPPPPGYGAPITLEQAKAAIAAAAAESKNNGWNHVFAVVDGGGNLIAFEKSDLAGNSSINIAQAKATSSATFRVPTKAYQDRLAAGETFILGLPGMVPAAGGVPIVVNGKIIGAIGVSGATPLQDHQSGVAGAAAVK